MHFFVNLSLFFLKIANYEVTIKFGNILRLLIDLVVINDENEFESCCNIHIN